MLNELTNEQIKNLSLSELVKRMDQILSYHHEEKYGHLPSSFDFVKQNDIRSISEFIETKLISGKDERAKRKLAYCAFRFITQIELLYASCGISNIVADYYEKDYWNSPSYCMKIAVLHQYQIVASRIALECFFHLIYMIDTVSGK